MRKRELVGIGIVDDQGFPPLDNLNDSGFRLFFIGNINDVRKTEGFDVLLCDIMGVSTKLSSSNQGYALICEIRKHYPDKITIVYTGSSTRTKIVRDAIDICDEYIPKSAELDQWITKLDKSIDLALDPVDKWHRIKLRLSELRVPSKQLSEIEHLFVKSLKKNNKSYFEKKISKIDISDDIKPILQGLVVSAIWASL